MASIPITSSQVDGETMEPVRDFIFLGSKIIADGDCSHEMKRRVLLGRKAMTYLNNIVKSGDITLLTKVCIVKPIVFPCTDESWTIRKASVEELTLSDRGAGEDSSRVPWTARRSNQSILKEINPEYSLEAPMLKLKFQHFGHLMCRGNSLEKTLTLGMTEGNRRRGSRR